MAASNSYVNHNSLDYQLGGEDQPNFSGSRIEIGSNTSIENLPIRSPLAASKVVKNRPTGLIISYLVIICISLFVAVLVVAGRPRIVEFKSQNKDKYICSDEICQSYVEDLSSVMKPDVEPCDDFYEYVCGNWSQVHPLNGHLLSTPAQIAQAQVDQRLADYLGNIRYSEVAIENEDPHEIAAYMFNSCLEKFDENQVTDLTTLVREFGGWPLVGDTFDDKISNIIHYNFMARKEFNLNMIFDINVLPNPLKAESFVLVISTSSLLFQPTIISEKTPFYAGPDDEIAQKLKNVITELYPQANNPNMLKDLEDVIELEKNLLALKNGAISNYNKNYKNMAEAILGMKKTLKQLNDLIPLKGESDPANWVEVIKELLGNSITVDENYEIGVEISTVNATLNVLYKTEIKTVKNWFVYKVLSTLGPRFSAKLRQVFLGTGPKATFCAYEVNSLMHFATADIYDARYWSSMSKKFRDMVLDLAKEVKSASTKALVSSSWLDEKTKQTLIEKLENITIKIGFPDWIKDRTKLTAYYDLKYSEHSGNETYTYLDVAGWILKLNWPRQVQQLKEKFIREDFWSDKNMVNVNAWYNPLDNSITFPIGFLDYPMFAGSSHPKYLIFGMLGSVIGHEIFHSLDPSGIIFDGHGQLNNKAFDEKFTQEYDNKLQCLVNQYKATTKREVLTITEDFADNAAVQFIFKAYAESKSDVFHDNYLPHTDIFSNKLSKAQLFYISYASNWCEETTEVYDNIVKNDVHSHGRDRVIIPLQNSKSFSKVFKCPVGSIMNPAQKCEIF